MASAALMAQGIEKRRHILRYIKTFQKKNGYSPTLTEITEELDFASKNAVRHHLAILEQEGFVAQTPRKHRSLKVTNTGRYPR